MTKILQKEPVRINCPHCKLEMTEAWICEMNSVLGLRFAYICSNCEKLVSISKTPITTSINGQGRTNFLQN